MGKVKHFTIEIDNKNVELYFKPPTQDEVLQIDMEYRRIYSIAVRNDIITQAEAIKQYRKSGAWSKDDESEVADLMFNLTLLESVINDDKKDIEERRKSAQDAASLRAELLDKMNVKTSLFDHTAESMAEKQKLHKFILLCTCNKEDDELYFSDGESYQNFLNENPDAGSELYREAYFYDYNLSQDISESWAEVKFLKDQAKEEIESEKEKEKEEQQEDSLTDKKNDKKTSKKKSKKKVVKK